ncbi:MAG: two pore domain potassium channel family protein [Reyranella sp.]|nr:two pore domain potassium channel family protein [Reyranella sp.]
MLLQFVVGAAACICNIAIHALVMLVLVWVAQHAAGASSLGPSMLLVAIMVATVSVLMMAHGVEVLVWAVTYGMVGAAPPGADVLYFAFVNYTTLGYGDVVPVERWRLLGPTTAMCGVLMFGWSTAVIFDVLRRALAILPQIPPVEIWRRQVKRLL